MGVLVAGFAAGLTALGWRAMAAGGWTLWEALILACLAVNAPWLGLTGATAVIGLAVRMLARDPLAAVLPAMRQPGWAAAAITARTAVAVCVRLEDMERVLPPLARLLQELRATPGGGDRFRLAILSDTPDGDAAAEEAAAVRRLAARFPQGAVWYRRRASNDGYKAGNLMDFLDRDAGEDEFLLVLDADSTMSAAAVRRLVRVMQADPGLAILQPTVGGTGAETPFARLFGLGHRHGTRIWATGQAWWQGPQGAYWGHNALIRIAPFREHARLPALPDGSTILSHDYVEAALLHAAGWAVRVLPEDAGSAERHPPDLVAYLDRDRRWSAGNLQYRHLLRRRDLGRIGRLQMLQAILHYALTPFWFALLPLAAVNAATGGGAATPAADLALLLLAGFLLLHLAKFCGYAEALLRPGPLPRPRLRELASEIGFSVAVDAILAAEKAAMTVAPGLAGWSPQQRAGRRLRWGQSALRLRFSLATGIVCGALFALAGPLALLLASPVLLGLLMAVPAVVLSASPACPAARKRAVAL